MAKDKAAPKLLANIAVAPIATSHVPSPKRKGPETAPNPSVSTKLKEAWRTNGKGLSLREYARKHDMGQAWLANKKAG
jgi:hypothetical protein